MEVLAIAVPAAAEQLGLSVRMTWELVRRGELRSCKVGRRRLVPIQALEEFLRHDHPLGRSPAARKAASGEVSAAPSR